MATKIGRGFLLNFLVGLEILFSIWVLQLFMVLIGGDGNLIDKLIPAYITSCAVTLWQAPSILFVVVMFSLTKKHVFLVGCSAFLIWMLIFYFLAGGSYLEQLQHTQVGGAQGLIVRDLFWFVFLSAASICSLIYLLFKKDGMK